MKKSSKGAAAAVAAAVLLLGGAGSLAYWNSETTVNGGTITAGDLGLTPVTAGTWTLNGAALTAPQVAALRIVPGDTVAYSGSYSVRAVGQNLRATAAATGGSVTGGLSSKLTTTVTTTLGGQPLTTITSANNGDTVAVTANFDFPFGTVVDNTSKTLTADLSNVVITLTQTDATP